MRTTPLKVVCYVPTFNAGDTTRGIEVTRALEARAAEAGRELDILFVCPPIKVAHFEALILKAGYRIAHTAVPLSQADIDNFMNADRTGEEFIPEYDRAKLYIEKYIENLREHKPDLLINGCIPPAGVAARILGIPTVTYFPFPADKAWVERYFLKDIPDQLENALTLRLPAFLRGKLTRLLSKLATKQRFFSQPTLARAGRELGWSEPQPGIFTMLKADVELVNDLPIFYEGQTLGPRTRVTGPLFSRGAEAALDPKILEMFDPKNANKVLVTMGSSGEKKHLLEAIAAVSEPGYHAVAVVQPTICSIAEVRARLKIPAHVYLTDSFIPAHLVNPLADAVIIHGGQGTVQNAMFSGTPFVGVGMQAEQQTNLDNFALQGAGIRISRKFWKRNAIGAALRRVLAETSFKANAARMAVSFAGIDGYKEAGNAIWELVEARKL